LNVADVTLAKLILIILILFPGKILAGTWLAEKGRYNLYGSYSSLTNLNKGHIKRNIENYYKIHRLKLLPVYRKKYELEKQKNKLPSYVYLQRKAILDRAEEAAKAERERFNTEFLTETAYFELEYGATENTAIGASASYNTNYDFAKAVEKNSRDFSFYLKRKIWQNQKWLFTIQGGGRVDDPKKDIIIPQIGFNLARQTINKKGWKYITEANLLFGYKNFKGEIKVPTSAKFSQGVEFTNGVLIQLSDFVSFYPADYLSREYFARDQLTVAKIFTRGNLHILNDFSISVSFYSDYTLKKRKKVGDGIQFGIGVKL